MDHNQVDQYGRQYPNSKYQRPAITCDAIVEKTIDGDRKILLITRGHPPQVGLLAFPGGHLDYNEEPKVCCLRELREETGLIGLEATLVDVRGHPLRDTRGHYITIIYRVFVADDADPTAGDDAASVQWYPLKEVLEKSIEFINIQQEELFAFDHHDILNQYAVSGSSKEMK